MTEVSSGFGPLPPLPEDPALDERVGRILDRYPDPRWLQDNEPPQGTQSDTQPKEGEQ